MKTKVLIMSLVAFSTLLGSCMAPVGHPDPYVRQGRRTGAVVGGVAGAVIGNNTGMGSWGGAAIGAAVGGLAGDRRGKVNSMYYGGAPRYYY
jgi:uncharacterized membrane protein